MDVIGLEKNNEGYRHPAKTKEEKRRWRRERVGNNYGHGNKNWRRYEPRMVKRKMAAKMVKKVVSSNTLRDSPKNMVSSTALRTMATVEMKVRVRDPNRFKITEMLKPYTALSEGTHTTRTLKYKSKCVKNTHT